MSSSLRAATSTELDVRRRVILGCPVDCVSFAEVIALVEEAAQGNRSPLQIVTANVDIIMKAQRSSVFRQELWSSDLVVPDGVPLLWAASLVKQPLAGRVNGTDLVLACAELAAKTDVSIALVGGRAGVAARAAEVMKRSHGAARIHAIPTPPDLELENDDVAQRVRRTGARILLVALGAPKQERWIRTHLARTHAAVGVGVGSAFDIISNDRFRAPRFLREHGFEWLVRVLQEPRRLGPRYARDSIFFALVARDVLRRARKPEVNGSVTES